MASTTSTTDNGQPFNYDDPDQVNALIETIQAVENIRAQDRALIDILMNGKRPYTEDEVKKHQIRINVNFNEGNRILQDANRQVNNATLYPARLATLKCLEGPIEKQEEWGQKVTTIFNRILKKKKSGRRHMFVRKSRNASLVLHGVGVMMWMKRDDWLPRFIPLEDLLIPTDTGLGLENLQYFAVNLYLTQREFFDLSQEGKDKGWNKEYCHAILKALHQPNNNQSTNWLERPENWQELFKQSSVYYDNDKVSRVRLRAFFYQKTENGKVKWYRKYVLRENPGAKLDLGEDMSGKFVYTDSKPFADDIDQILHMQYGDCSIVPPLKVHSVRGLGTLLYAVVEIMNRLRCQFIQAAFDNLMQLIRLNEPLDRAIPLLVQLFPYAVVQQGTSFVKNDERHIPDQALAESALAQGKQNMSENSSSFVQNVDNGTRKEMTATEAQARINSVNVMVGGMLQSMYGQEESYFEEVLRRFCQKNPTDEDIKYFQDECKRQGVPIQVLDPKWWQVDVERVMGAGDQMIAQQKADALLSQSQRFDPTSQRIILRQWTSVTTDNPDQANALVPEQPPQASEGVVTAEQDFGTLMQGVMVSPREGIPRQDYIESLLGMYSAKIGELMEGEQRGESADYYTLKGLDSTQQAIAQNIQIFEQNEDNKQLVRQYEDMLGQLNNKTKMLIQHWKESNQARQDAEQMNPEAQAKANVTLMLGEAKKQVMMGNFQLKQAQSQAKFEQSMSQKYDKHVADLNAQITQLRADLVEQSARTRADILAKEKAAESETPAA